MSAVYLIFPSLVLCFVYTTEVIRGVTSSISFPILLRPPFTFQNHTQTPPAWPLWLFLHKPLCVKLHENMHQVLASPANTTVVHSTLATRRRDRSSLSAMLESYSFKDWKSSLQAVDRNTRGKEERQTQRPQSAWHFVGVVQGYRGWAKVMLTSWDIHNSK